MGTILDIQNSTNQMFVGLDECGTGSYAGQLVVCGVKAPRDWSVPGLNDSKKLSEKKRVTLCVQLTELINKKEIQCHIAERSNTMIDQMGMGVALKDAYVECIRALDIDKNSLCIVDGTLKFNNLGVDDHQITSLIKADTQIPSVMAASIIGKTYRDAKMRELHKLYPVYQWIDNVGYGSSAHKKALVEHGPSPLHRMSYAPLKNLK